MEATSLFSYKQSSNGETEEDQDMVDAKLERLLPIHPDDRKVNVLEDIALLLASEYKVFAKLEEQNKDMLEIVKPITMSSYESGMNIINIGDSNHEFVYIIISGFWGIFQKELNEELNIMEDKRVGNLIKGSIFGELYLIFNIPSKVFVRTEERTKVMKIPKDTFDKYIKDYYMENIENMIEFFKELLGEKAELKYLLLLASVTQQKSLSSGVIAIKQGDPWKYIYFIKSGMFKMLRYVDFPRDIEERAIVLEDHYNDPTPEDYENSNIRPRLLEVDKLEKYYSFGDRNLPPENENEEQFEPFTVVSVLPSELYIIERNVFLQLLPKHYTLKFKTFPDDYQLRKRFYEQKCWKVFKNDVFNTLVVQKKSPKSNEILTNRKSEPIKLPKITSKYDHKIEPMSTRRETIFNSLGISNKSKGHPAPKVSVICQRDEIF